MKNNRNSNKKKGAFLLRPVQVQNGRKNRLTAFLADVCFVWLYLAGMTFWLESSLQLDISIEICLLAALAAALLQQLAAGGWSENGAGRRWLGILSWCGALAVIAWRHIRCGSVVSIRSAIMQLTCWGIGFRTCFHPML